MTELDYRPRNLQRPDGGPCKCGHAYAVHKPHCVTICEPPALVLHCAECENGGCLNYEPKEKP